uniref:Calponin-homology (CH) domain-containing protein n=1 Tax=Arcella intermedia TaxID=1963864 RepID=A0A6B2KYN6_9EUKA
MEEKRKEEEKRALEEKRKAEEKRALEEKKLKELEEKKKAEERRLLEEKRKEEEKRALEEKRKAEEKRALEEKKLKAEERKKEEDKKAEEKRKEEEKRLLEEKKKEEERRALENLKRKEEEKKAEEQKREEERKRVEEKKLLEEKKKEEERRQEELRRKEERKKMEDNQKKKQTELDQKWKEQQEQEENKADMERQRLEEDRQRRLEEARKRAADARAIRNAEDKRPYSAYTAITTISFKALNKHGQTRKSGGDGDLFTAYGNGKKIQRIEDMGDGTYCFDYNCIPGLNTIDVRFNGQSIKGFPITFSRKSEAQLSEERALEINLKAKEEEERLKEEERIREEANKLLEQVRQRQEQERKVREGERASHVRISREAMPKYNESETSEDAEKRIQEKRTEVTRKRLNLPLAINQIPEVPVIDVTSQLSPRIRLWQEQLDKQQQQEEAKAVVSPRRERTTSRNKLANAWEQKILETENGTKAEKPKGNTLPALDEEHRSNIGTKFSMWEQLAQTVVEEPKVIKGGSAPRDPNKVALGKLWESQMSSSAPGGQTGLNKDIEELKSLMEKEKDKISTSSILFHFLNEEKVSTRVLLADDPTAFDYLSDGVAICLFLAKRAPKVMDHSMIIKPATSQQQKVANWNLCLKCLASSNLENVNMDSLVNGDKEEVLMVLWEAVKVSLEVEVKQETKYFNETFQDSDWQTWSLEILLLNWVNEIAAERGVSRTASSLTEDFKVLF